MPRCNITPGLSNLNKIQLVFWNHLYVYPDMSLVCCSNGVVSLMNSVLIWHLLLPNCELYGLTDHIHQIVTGLLRIHTPDCILPFYYDLRSNEPSGVAGMCMAVIVLAVKMCYGLDGVQEFNCQCPG